jgi:hypothetical protein
LARKSVQKQHSGLIRDTKKWLAISCKPLFLLYFL